MKKYKSLLNLLRKLQNSHCLKQKRRYIHTIRFQFFKNTKSNKYRPNEPDSADSHVHPNIRPSFGAIRCILIHLQPYILITKIQLMDTITASFGH